jgi:hypothetical protein
MESAPKSAAADMRNIVFMAYLLYDIRFLSSRFDTGNG